MRNTRKKKIVMLLIFTGIAITANALVFGGSNLTFIGYPGFMGYPECDCKKPYKPYQFNSQYEIDSFNDEVNRYIDCVNEYMENADNDMKRIKEAKDDAYNEATRFLNTL